MRVPTVLNRRSFCTQRMPYVRICRVTSCGSDRCSPAIGSRMSSATSHFRARTQSGCASIASVNLRDVWSIDHPLGGGPPSTKEETFGDFFRIESRLERVRVLRHSHGISQAGKRRSLVDQKARLHSELNACERMRNGTTFSSSTNVNVNGALTPLGAL